MLNAFCTQNRTKFQRERERQKSQVSCAQSSSKQIDINKPPYGRNFNWGCFCGFKTRGSDCLPSCLKRINNVTSRVSITLLEHTV